VIIATGAISLKPQIVGIDGENISTAWQVLKGDVPKDKKVVVIGGGVTGVETAEILAMNGNKVTIVEQLDQIAGDAVPMPFYYLALLKTLKMLDIKTMTGMTVQEITENDVIGESNGERISIQADRVVLALGIEPNNGLARQLDNLGIEMYKVGDCAGTGQLPKAIREGFKAGLVV
jgi:pyruvate/2-oxoglutarate dehydrogenase complex dihydrolipoamide dehydrogenase (E3) component